MRFDAFTSDLHFNHVNVIEYCARPFADIEEMTETLINRWNNRISESDVVCVLGDFSFGRYSAIESVFRRLSGEIVLVRGNHDNRITPRRYLDMGFAAVLDLAHCMVGGLPVVLTHRPLVTVPDGLWNLHGHTHSSAPRTGERSINVGVDAWGYAPVDTYDLTRVMRGGQASG